MIWGEEGAREPVLAGRDKRQEFVEAKAHARSNWPKWLYDQRTPIGGAVTPLPRMHPSSPGVDGSSGDREIVAGLEGVFATGADSAPGMSVEQWKDNRRRNKTFALLHPVAPHKLDFPTVASYADPEHKASGSAARAQRREPGVEAFLWCGEMFDDGKSADEVIAHIHTRTSGEHPFAHTVPRLYHWWRTTNSTERIARDVRRCRKKWRGGTRATTVVDTTFSPAWQRPADWDDLWVLDDADKGEWSDTARETIRLMAANIGELTAAVYRRLGSPRILAGSIEAILLLLHRMTADGTTRPRLSHRDVRAYIPASLAAARVIEAIAATVGSVLLPEKRRGNPGRAVGFRIANRIGVQISRLRRTLGDNAPAVPAAGSRRCFSGGLLDPGCPLWLGPATALTQDVRLGLILALPAVRATGRVDEWAVRQAMRGGFGYSERRARELARRVAQATCALGLLDGEGEQTWTTGLWHPGWAADAATAADWIAAGEGRLRRRVSLHAQERNEWRGWVHDDDGVPFLSWEALIRDQEIIQRFQEVRKSCEARLAARRLRRGAAHRSEAEALVEILRVTDARIDDDAEWLSTLIKKGRGKAPKLTKRRRQLYRIATGHHQEATRGIARMFIWIRDVSAAYGIVDFDDIRQVVAEAALAWILTDDGRTARMLRGGHAPDCLSQVSAARRRDRANRMTINEDQHRAFMDTLRRAHNSMSRGLSPLTGLEDRAGMILGYIAVMGKHNMLANANVRRTHGHVLRTGDTADAPAHLAGCAVTGDDDVTFRPEAVWEPRVVAGEDAGGDAGKPPRLRCLEHCRRHDDAHPTRRQLLAA